MKQLSNCHKAPATVDTADEGTSCYVCSECKRPCDLFIDYELLDCPFCGKQPKIEHVRTDCYLTGEIEIFTEISCSNNECAFGMDSSSQENAIEAWNKRAT